MAELNTKFTTNIQVEDSPVYIINNDTELEEGLKHLKQFKYIALDTETKAKPRYVSELKNIAGHTFGDKFVRPLDPHLGEIRLIQMKGEDNNIFIFDLDYISDKAKAKLKTFFTDSSKVAIGQTLKFECKMFWGSGLDIEFVLFDTQLASQVLTAGMDLEHGLADILYRYLGIEISKELQSSDWSGNLTIDQYIYAAKDVIYLHNLRKILVSQILKKGLINAAQIEFEAIYPTAAMEYNGITVDLNRWNDLIPIYEKQRDDALDYLKSKLPNIYYQQTVFGSTFTDFNPSSNKQILHRLQQVGVKDPREEPEFKGKLIQGTGKDVLKLLDYQLGHEDNEDVEETVDALLNHRQADKLLNSFIYTLPKLIHPTTGRLHCGLNQHGAATSRYCIAGDQRVLVPGGYTLMKDLKVGDLVYCYDDNNKPTIRPVLNKWCVGKLPTIKLNWKSRCSTKKERTGSLVCTAKHKIKTIKYGWVEAGELEPGDRLVNLSKKYLGIGTRKLITLCNQLGIDYFNHQVVSIEEDKTQLVYDIEVDEYHNFICEDICVSNSSNSPNMQQIPRSGDIRRCFVASKEQNKDWVLVISDFSQIEVRIVAEHAKEAKMIEVFKRDEDIYKSTVASMNNIDVKDVDKDARQKGKACILGLNYCFIPGTKVITNSGVKNIEDITTKDEVLTIKDRYRPVTATNVRKSSKLIKVTTNTGKVLQSTPEHKHLKFCPVNNKKGIRTSYCSWVKAKDLKIGDYLVYHRQIHSNDEKVVSIEELDYDGFVYDISVKEDHSFIANGLITHNCMQAKKFRRQLKTGYNIKMPFTEVSALRAKYFRTYPGLYEWHENLKKHHQKDKMAKNINGRFRVWDYPPGISALANYPIQSLSAEITKHSLYLLYWALRKFGRDARILLTVHDEIIVECLREISDQVAVILQDCMVKGGQRFLSICPVKADVSIGTDWSDK